MIQGKEDKIAVVVGTITEDPRLIGQFAFIPLVQIANSFPSLLFVLDFFRISFASIHRIAQAESVRAEADRHRSRPNSQGRR